MRPVWGVVGRDIARYLQVLRHVIDLSRASASGLHFGAFCGRVRRSGAAGRRGRPELPSRFRGVHWIWHPEK